LHVGFARKGIVLDRARLQRFALYQRGRGLRQVNIQVMVGRHQFVDRGEQEVAGQESESPPPERVHRWPATAKNAMVIDIVVNDACCVHQFNGGGRPADIVEVAPTERQICEQQQAGPDSFSAGAQDMAAGVAQDVNIAICHRKHGALNSRQPVSDQIVQLHAVDCCAGHIGLQIIIVKFRTI